MEAHDYIIAFLAVLSISIGVFNFIRSKKFARIDGQKITNKKGEKYYEKIN